MLFALRFLLFASPVRPLAVASHPPGQLCHRAELGIEEVELSFL